MSRTQDAIDDKGIEGEMSGPDAPGRTSFSI